jgi:hypothetical protein
LPLSELEILNLFFKRNFHGCKPSLTRNLG